MIGTDTQKKQTRGLRTSDSERGLHTSLEENIPHLTDTRPFSVHHTLVREDVEPALYLHCHKEMEFLLLKRGSISFSIEGTERNMEAGDAVFIPSNLLHSARTLKKEECEFFAVVFDAGMIMDSSSYGYFPAVPIDFYLEMEVLHRSPDREAIEALERIFAAIDRPAKECELMIRGQLMTVWQCIYNKHLSGYADDYSRSLSAVRRAVELMDSRYTDALTLEEIAQAAGMSEGYFCRVFKAQTGFTPFEYINRQRIARSCEMLKDSGKRIADIAIECGYNNISYFNRTFAKFLKVSPSEYRYKL